MTTTDAAHQIQEQVIEVLHAERQGWPKLAALIHALHQASAWKDLGADTFAGWMAAPEIALSRSRGYLLLAIQETIVVEGGADPGELADLDAAKFTHVLAHVRAGTLGVEEAIADVRALSRSDLRAKYARIAIEEEVELCPTCNQPIKA